MAKRRVRSERWNVDPCNTVCRSAIVATAWLTLAGCNGGPTNVGGDGAVDAVMSDRVFTILDGSDDAVDAADAPVDVQPAALPGRWRLVQWTSMGISGSETLTDVDPTAGAQSSRVNGTLTLSADRMSVTVGRLDLGHFAVDPLQGTAALAVGAAHTVTLGTLGAAAFTPNGMSDVVFSTLADGTITYRGTFGNLGPAETTWQRADGLPALSAVRGQGYVVKLQPTASAAMAAPRALIAWDRPGNGYTYTDDAALRFIGTGIAAINLDTAVAPVDAVGMIGDTAISVGYLVVYDDRNGNGRYDPPATSGAPDGGMDAASTTDGSVGVSDGGALGDGGTMGGADALRGVSPIVIVLRNGPGASAAWQASAFADLLPGTQIALMKPDATVPGVGMSLGLFDTTHPVTPDAVVEPLPLASLPDLVP